MSDIEKDKIILKTMLMKNKENIKHKIIEIYNSEDINTFYKIWNVDKFFYTSYHNKTDILERKYIWCSDVFSQSLLHIFNVIRGIKATIEPHIYRFTFTEEIKLLQSPNKNNIDIFRYIFDDSLIDEINKYFIETYKNILEDIFSGEKNIRILLILEIINEFLPKKMRFNGYYNIYDQSETAIINTNIISNITESKYISIKLKKEHNILNFPCSKEDFDNLLSLQPIHYTDIINISPEELKPSIKPSLKPKEFVSFNFGKLGGLEGEELGGLEGEELGGLEGEELGGLEGEELGGLEGGKFGGALFMNDKFRMICQKDLVEYIEYIDFDTRENKKYLCLLPREYYYEQKYLKYKTKYLKLKKLI
jgi:hypothetical protein